MDRRLNIVIYLAVIFLFCQAQVHTTSKSQCVKHRKYINVKEIDEHFHVPKRHICATRIDYCAGLCHSVDQLLRGDGDLQTKCECCQPITLEEKKDTIVYCVNRKSKSRYLASKTVKVPVIKSCGCTPCLSLRTSWFSTVTWLFERGPKEMDFVYFGFLWSIHVDVDYLNTLLCFKDFILEYDNNLVNELRDRPLPLGGKFFFRWYGRFAPSFRRFFHQVRGGRCYSSNQFKNYSFDSVFQLNTHFEKSLVICYWKSYSFV